MAKVVVDNETGEILRELAEGDIIITKKQIDNTVVKIPKGERFSKVYNESIWIMSECKLSAAEYQMMLFLATNLRYKSNMCKYENGKVITRQNLMNDLLMSEITVKRSIAKLIKEGLLVEAKTLEGRVFIMNPYVFMVDDTLNRTTHDLFRKTKWAREWR